jgi:hypothetical protein
MASKPRVRVKAKGEIRNEHQFTTDNFTNFSAQLGYGTQNLSSGSTYGFNPISRNKNLLEWMYRGSWLVKKVVDCPADDMTREGMQIESDMPPDQIDALTNYWTDLQIWQKLNETIKWARLYGGCLAVIMIDGQDMETPLRIDTIRKGQFKGVIVYDKWMVWPTMDQVVTDFGPDFGLPKYYDTVADAKAVPNMRIHHTRCIRIDGVTLPYWQRVSENMWGLSVIEPLWDRMIAFDSATTGAAQLIYKAHLRVMKIEDYREIVAAGGKMYEGLRKQIEMMRLMQTNEGITIIDKEDEFIANTYSFAGLSDMMMQFSQQLSGAADVPETRLFGQAPAGMNSTGESDLRNYYDGIKSQQETRLRRYITKLLDITHRSLTGLPLPGGFNYSFRPLWQLTPEQQADIATKLATATSTLFQDGVISQKTAMKEIRQSSRITGFGSNITDEDINAVPDGPPDPFAGEQVEAEAKAASRPVGAGGLAATPGAGGTPQMPPAAQPASLASPPEDDGLTIPKPPPSWQVSAETQGLAIEHQAAQLERQAEVVEKAAETLEQQAAAMEQRVEKPEHLNGR